MKKLKVGIDIGGLHEMSKTRGIGFYTENLYQSLKKYTSHEIFLIMSYDRSTESDVIHYPYFDLFRNTLKPHTKIPIVVTIHDVIPLIFPKHYPIGIKGKINLYKQKRALNNVSTIVTDSQSSKKDIIKYLGVSSEKIQVIYLAPSESFKPIDNVIRLQEVKKRFNLPDKFAIYIGGINWNKNLIGIASACVEADLDIFFIGKGFETKTQYDHPELKPFKDFLDKYSNNPKVHILGFVEEEEMIGILNLATVALQPSFYEGFGLPILEAQSCGVPVICSKNSSMPEVAGSGALFVEPDELSSIKNAIVSVLSSPKLRVELAKKGMDNIKRFSWEKTARQTSSIYEKVTRG